MTPEALRLALVSGAGAAAPLITGWALGSRKQFGVAIVLAGASPPLATACLLAAGAEGLERVRRKFGDDA